SILPFRVQNAGDRLGSRGRWSIPTPTAERRRVMSVLLKELVKDLPLLELLVWLLVVPLGMYVGFWVMLFGIWRRWSAISVIVSGEWFEALTGRCRNSASPQCNSTSRLLI